MFDCNNHNHHLNETPDADFQSIEDIFLQQMKETKVIMILIECLITIFNLLRIYLL
jgi:hypothetical protein